MSSTSYPLQRLRHNRLFGGVCSGIAHYLGLSCLFVRLSFLILILFAGLGLLLYLILWLIIPLQSAEEASNMPRTQAHMLYRSLHNRKIAGVCGGLGTALGIDPTVVRVLFVITLLFAGSALFIYLVLWLIMPLELGNPA